jgi:hypothetical protein
MHVSPRVSLGASLGASLALGLFGMLWTGVADAATAHRSRARQHLILRPSPEVAPPAWSNSPGWSNSLGWKPIPPEENRNFDASTRGGA